MPLREPPLTPILQALPRTPLRGRVLHRLYRADRADPWWFASLSRSAPPGSGGRFDLPEPLGACYLATSAAAAVLETFQDFTGLLPDTELKARRRAEVLAPQGAPPAAALTAARSRGVGVTAALWASADRELTQRWALALLRSGWVAMFHGIAHDPGGRLRAVTLLDSAGEHDPYDDPRWAASTHRLHDDPTVLTALARYGITVTRGDVELPVIPLPDAGLDIG